MTVLFTYNVARYQLRRATAEVRAGLVSFPATVRTVVMVLRTLPAQECRRLLAGHIGLVVLPHKPVWQSSRVWCAYLCKANDGYGRLMLSFRDLVVQPDSPLVREGVGFHYTLAFWEMLANRRWQRFCRRYGIMLPRGKFSEWPHIRHGGCFEICHLDDDNEGVVRHGPYAPTRWRIMALRLFFHLHNALQNDKLGVLEPHASSLVITRENILEICKHPVVFLREFSPLWQKWQAVAALQKGTATDADTSVAAVIVGERL